MRKAMKWLAQPSRTMRATTGATITRLATLCASLAPVFALLFLWFAEWETATEAKLATFLTALITMLAIAPMVWQFSKTCKGL